MCDVVARSQGEKEAITFVELEASAVVGPHHDTLVVQITIANLDVQRVLVDNGSSANVLFLSTLREM